MKKFIKKSFCVLTALMLCAPFLTKAGDITTGKSNGNSTAILQSCPTFTFTVKTANVSCYGGSNGKATAVPSGGTAPYTYSWSGGTTTDSLATNLSAGTYTVTATDFNGCIGTQTLTITQPAQLRDSISASTEVSCYGGTNGSATVGVKGGTFFYTYLWTPSGLASSTVTGAAGTYKVVVTDRKGCKDSAYATITQPTAIKDTVDIINVACKGGSTGKAIAVVSGGTPGYTYTWSPSGGTKDTATGLVAGTYTVNIKDKNGCTATKSGIVNQPAIALVVSASQKTPADCKAADGVAYATVTGGNVILPYVFAWAPTGGTNDTAKGIASGSYTVAVTDSNGCTVTASTSIASNSTLSVTVSAATNVSPCYGDNNGTATATATNGTPGYTYSWSNGATTSTLSNLAASGYTITVTDAAGCTATANTTITQPTQVKDTVLTSTNVSCYADSNGAATVTASGGSGTYTYLWSNSATTSSITGLKIGIYSVTATDGNGCSYTTKTTITQPKAIRDSVTSRTTISCNGGTARVNIGVSGGTPGYTYSWAPSGGTRNRITASAGTYTLTITDAKGCTKIDSVTITQPPLLTAKITDSTMVACFGSKTGSEVVTASGGTTPYTYAWAASGGTKDTASNLGFGTYTVTVTDSNGCRASVTTKVTQPASAVTATGRSYAASCGKSNGAAAVTATGGTPGYVYNWTPAGGSTDSASGLGQGIYACTITDLNGCTYTVSVNVADTTTLAVKLVSSSDVTPCFGDHNGSATFRPSGGTPGYTYNWAPFGGIDTIANGLSAQTYTFTVTDSKGCKVSDTVTITRPPFLSATITPVNVSCNTGTNGSATAKVTGGVAGYTYSWAPSGGTSSTTTPLGAGIYTVTVTDKNGCTTKDSVTITQPTAITTSISSTNISCFGSASGTAKVTVGGGTPAYRYTWATGGNTTDSVSNLNAGTYTVTVRDANGCNATQTVTIIQPTQIRDSIASSVNVLCNGGNSGSATEGVKGGTPGYTYSWTPSGQTGATASNLTAGAYTVTVTDANGCKGTSSKITLTQPTALDDTTKAIAASCGKSNGSAVIHYLSGGTTPYTYAWSTGASTTSISNVAAGTYTCTISDGNGCTISPVVIVADSSTLAATISGVTSVTCNGNCDGGASVNVTGGTPTYTYSWTGGITTTSATGLCAGKVNVTVTDSKGCIVSDTVTIQQPMPLTVTIDSNVIGGCSNSAWAIVNGGTKPYTYSWTGSQTTDTATGLCIGNTYTVTVTDANNCTANNTVTITAPTGVAQLQGTSEIKVYPVPSTGNLNISISGSSFVPQSVSVFDMTGRTLLEQKVSMTSNILSLNLSTLEQGTYILKLVSVTGDEKLERFTIVK